MKLLFIGTPAFAAAILNDLIARGHEVVQVICQPDRGFGRGRKQTVGAVKKAASSHRIRVMQPHRIDDAVVRSVQASSAQLGVVAAFGMLLPQALLDSVPFVNVHTSLLPRWRGAAPIQRSIEHGDSRTGVTIMKMTAQLDSGPIIARRALDIGPRETAGSLQSRLTGLAMQLLSETLKCYPHWCLQPQSECAVSYARKIATTERFLDCANVDADVLERRIRAFNPTPGCWMTIRKQRCKVHLARLVKRQLTPGEPIRQEGDLLIGCRRGSLQLECIQPAGGRIMSGRDFINGVWRDEQ